MSVAAPPKFNYRRTPAQVRETAQAFRRATKGADGAKLFERLSAWDPTSAGESKGHSASYVSAIMEAATDFGDDGDPRAFAKEFLGREATYSSTQAGKAALQFESWLIQEGSTLYRRFVETVLDSGGKTFVAIFEGIVAQGDFIKMQGQTQSFVSIKPLISAGSVNHSCGEVMEFTFFDCAAVNRPKRSDDISGVPSMQTPLPSDLETVGAGRVVRESLLPQDRDAYDRVVEDGGLTREELEVVLGGEGSFDVVYQHESQWAVDDANGVRWVSEDEALWVPDVDNFPGDVAISEEDDLDEGTKPTNYRKSTNSSIRCGTCTHFKERGVKGHCTMFDWSVAGDMTCDEWASGRHTQGPTVDGDRMAKEHAGIREDHPVIECDLATGAMRSRFRSWAILGGVASLNEAGQEEQVTAVVFGDSAYVLDDELDEAGEAIAAVAETYEGSPAEADAVIEQMLREVCADEGELCDNEDELRRLVEVSDDRPTIADRNHAIEEASHSRLDEAAVVDVNPRPAAGQNSTAHKICREIESQLKSHVKGRLFTCHFDNRFGGGSIYVTFANVPPGTTGVRFMNDKERRQISIGPFSSDGEPTGDKLVAKMIASYHRASAIGWRKKTAPPDKIAQYVVGYFKKQTFDDVADETFESTESDLTQEAELLLRESYPDVEEGGDRWAELLGAYTRTLLSEERAAVNPQ